MAETGAARPRDRDLVDRMLKLFELEPVETDRFRIPGLPTEPRRVFGGQLVAQALSAATRTVGDGRLVHSLHAYFVRSGDTGSALDFAVSRDGDGSTISFRRVLVTQADRVLLNLSAGFQGPTDGLEHQIAAPPAPPPESLEDDYAQAAAMDGLTPEARTLVNRASPFQFRSLNNSDRLGTDPAPARQAFWFRLARPLDGADQGLQRVILTYASDMMLLGTGLMPHGLRWFDGRARIASLDHALWIHGPVRMDDWLFYAQDSPWTGEGRGLNLGRIFDRAGRLVASVSQEGSMRLPG